ncbi:MAG: lipoprotein-releasing ABC transporter permease subunit [Gammaproteobacteria bacterium]|nr:lipoprotein-releasing ABC transporter permease subunit [Gammaproteobacteria bacterium]MDH5303247.1 lipoprotein-releasing ABC transporter permease subunit [Gammaproteobacteria bacterium]MDH5322561.1 lipoprotein-releasing ABC transporter permease subunit [Gammaproteobacteria bacterium]
MINPVELFVGLRYLRAKRRTRFVSFITLISLAGVALGVAALIVILSVMNGFEGELRTRLLSMSAHGQIASADGASDDWRSLHRSVLEHPGVAAAAPLVQMEGMIQSGRELRAVLAHGIEPEYESTLSEPPLNLLEGTLDSLQPGSRKIILGRLLAVDLGLYLGDAVVMLIPRPAGDGTLRPVLERFELSGVFEAGLQEHDASLALVSASDAAAILGLGAARSAVRFRAYDVMAAPQIAAELREQLGSDVVSSDWTIENASYFRAIRIEKMMMSLILSLIIAVAAFNIVASLVMVVTDKTNDIAVLRTLGMRPAGVVKVFFIQGAVIGWAGVFIGVALGIVLAINVPVIVPFLEQTLGFQIMPGDVFYVTRIPSELESADVTTIAISAFLLTSLATLYPARRAAHVNPAVALRYE